MDLDIVVVVISAYFLPVKDGSKLVTGALIRPERRFGSSGTACTANASGSPSTYASSASVGTLFSFSGGSSTSFIAASCYSSP